jgi:hypothetical protein
MMADRKATGAASKYSNHSNETATTAEKRGDRRSALHRLRSLEISYLTAEALVVKKFGHACLSTNGSW